MKLINLIVNALGWVFLIAITFQLVKLLFKTKATTKAPEDPKGGSPKSKDFSLYRYELPHPLKGFLHVRIPSFHERMEISSHFQNKSPQDSYATIIAFPFEDYIQTAEISFEGRSMSFSELKYYDVASKIMIDLMARITQGIPLTERKADIISLMK